MLPGSVVRGRQNFAYVKLPDRLRRARREAGVSRAGLSVDAGLSQNALYGIESGERIPRVDTIEKLAKALRLSPCMLAFAVEQPCEPFEGLYCAGLPERLSEIRQARGLSRLQLGQRSKTSDTLVRTTETGATMPNLAKLEALAKALDVSACWLAYGVGDRELPPLRRPPAQPANPAG